MNAVRKCPMIWSKMQKFRVVKSFSSDQFSIVELSVRKGKGIIANRDMLSGEVIFSESALMNVVGARNNVTSSFLSMYQCYLRLSSERKELFLSLYSPKLVSEDNDKYIYKIGNDLKQLYPKHKSDFIQFVSKCLFNAFIDENSFALYGTTSRLCHSCSPNVMLKHNAGVVSWTVVAPVQKGEELTVSYLGDDDLLPTFQRRRHLLQSKEFLCTCPRCTAPGDDTRQFDCFDTTCSGRYYVCQPLATDVPYLRPCNICKDLPTVDYEENVLRSEKKLPDLAKFLGRKSINTRRFREKKGVHPEEEMEMIEDESNYHEAKVLTDEESSERVNEQIKRVLRNSYHPYHVQFDPVLRRFAQHFSQTKQYGLLRRITENMVGALESRKGVMQVNDKTVDTYMWAGRYLAQCETKSNRGDHLMVTALSYLQKALAIHVMLHDEHESLKRMSIEKSIEELTGAQETL